MTRRRVNPPKQLVLPDSLQRNPDLKRAFDDRDYILFQLWERTGGGLDLVNNAISGLNEFDDLFLLEQQRQIRENVITTNTDYTTAGNDVIICTASVTVTLNDEPDNKETVAVRMLGGVIVINGNGRTINGSATAKIRTKYTSWQIMYIIETDEWIII